MDETHPLVGDEPYAIHRTACAGYYRAYARLYGLRTTVLRFSNPYGPHRSDQQFKGFGVLNHFGDLCLRGLPIRVFGDGRQLRDGVFVDDVVEAVIAAALRTESDGTAINVGAGEGIALLDIARQVVDVAGQGTIEHVPWPREYSVFETGDFFLDISRARDLLGWRPQTPLRKGLELTVESYRRWV